MPVDAAGDPGFIDIGAIDSAPIEAGAIDPGAIDPGAIDSGFMEAGIIDSGAIDWWAIDGAGMDATADGVEPPTEVLAAGELLLPLVQAPMTRRLVNASAPIAGKRTGTP